MSLVWRRILLGFAILLNLVLLYSLVWGAMGLGSYRDQKRLYTRLENNIAAVDRENIELEKEIALLQHDVKYQEKLIRSRLNFVKRNEILYIFPQSETEPAGVARDD